MNYPKHLVAEIVERFMPKKEFRDFMKKYEAAKLHHGGRMYVPTNQDIKLYESWLAGKLSIKEVSSAMECTPSTVHNRFSSITKALHSKKA